MSTCNHSLGHYDTERYDCWETTFVFLDDNDLETIQKLNSSNGSPHKFCPNCGENLEGVLAKKIIDIKADIAERQRQQDKAKQEAQKKFNKVVQEMSEKTGLNLLPQGNFVVVCEPVRSDKNLILSGPRDSILRNCVEVTQFSQEARAKFQVKQIYKIMSVEVFSQVMSEHGFEKVTHGFKRKTGTKVESVTYSEESGIVYVSTQLEDCSPSYSQLSVLRLGEYLKSEVKLEQVELT